MSRHTRQCKSATRGGAALMAAVALGFGAAAAPAGLISVPNHSFEPANGEFNAGDGGIFPNGMTSPTATIAGWEFNGPTDFKGIFDPNDGSFAGTTGDNAALAAPADGGQVAYVDIGDDSGASGSIASPDLDSVLSEHIYTLSVAVGRRLDNDFREAPDYQVHILLDDAIVGSSAVLDGSGLTAGTFTDLQATFTSGVSATGTLSVRLEATRDNVTGGFQQGLFDNVRLDAVPIPEPASMALLGLGGMLMLGRRRRVGYRFQ